MPQKGVVPARDWLFAAPEPVRLMIVAIVDSVRDGPPQSFPASNLWHVMHGEMKGLHEARDEFDGTRYRLFCVLDHDALKHGLPRRAMVLLCGGEKPVGEAPASAANPVH